MHMVTGLQFQLVVSITSSAIFTLQGKALELPGLLHLVLTIPSSFAERSGKDILTLTSALQKGNSICLHKPLMTT